MIVLIVLLILSMSSLIRGGPSNNSKSPISSTRMEKIRSNDDDNGDDDNGGDQEEIIVLGGGSINEKKRFHGDKNLRKDVFKNDTNDNETSSSITNFNPQSELSHLLHALAGLDRYPNYVSRWNYNAVQDIERLENALEEQLQKLRKQKNALFERNLRVRQLILEAKEATEQQQQQHHPQQNNHNDEEADIKLDWDILLNPPQSWRDIEDHVIDPRCINAIFQSKMFRQENRRPSVSDILEGNVNVELDAAQCEDWLNQELFDVYSFPLLKPSFCAKVRNMIKRLIEYQEEKRKSQEDNDIAVSTKNDISSAIGLRPIDMDMIGATWINDLLFHLIIRPLSRHLFQRTESLDELDWRQGYIVGYSKSPSRKDGAQRQRLVPHTDDSEVTLNIGMGEAFDGGELAFWGLRNGKDEGNYVGDFHPIIGTALLHAGRHLHEVKDVTNGNRFAYIIWARSWKGVRSTTCPCCWLNRRQQNTGDHGQNFCICGSRWN